MDCAAVRLRELADSGRLCLTAQVAESGARCRRVGPSRTTRGAQRSVHEGAVNMSERSGDSGRPTRAARGCGPSAAEAAGPGEFFDGCDWKSGDGKDKALAWL
eukprot:7474744-Alexandrium_andersonii.AAC.1